MICCIDFFLSIFTVNFYNYKYIPTALDTIEFLPFTFYILLYVAVLLLLLIFSAFVSGSETAFFSLSANDIKNLKLTESKSAKKVVKLLLKPAQLLYTVHTINTLVNITAVLVANDLVNHIVDFNGHYIIGISCKIIVIGFMLLLFGEMLPRISANDSPMTYSQKVAKTITLFCFILKPFSLLGIKIESMISKKIPKEENRISVDQIQDAIEITETNSPDEKLMLSGIARFSTTDVSDISVPRVDAVAIELSTKFTKVLEIIVESGFSRIPIYKDDFDHVVGVLYMKDLLKYIDENDDFQWHELMRKPYFVPENSKINNLLAEFQTRKIHMAIVVDEYGGTIGVITLEDILEEIVGEITDESDKKMSQYKKIDANTFVFLGRTHIGDLEKILGLPHEFFDQTKGEADTLAGLMLENYDSFFKHGDTVVIENIRFKAIKVDGFKIIKVKVIINNASYL